MNQTNGKHGFGRNEQKFFTHILHIFGQVHQMASRDIRQRGRRLELLRLHRPIVHLPIGALERPTNRLHRHISLVGHHDGLVLLRHRVHGSGIHSQRLEIVEVKPMYFIT